MSQAAFGLPGWLPARSRRAMLAEEAAEHREAKQAEAEREARREEAHDGALALYRSQAENRGEVVSVMALARGETGGRSMADILAAAQGAADREDARQASRDRREGVCYVDAEPVLHHSAGRSSWPSSEYELDRQLRQASDLHRDLVAYRARRDYPAAVAAARAKSTRAPATRSEQDSHSPEILRVTPQDHYCRRCGGLGEWCRCR